MCTTILWHKERLYLVQESENLLCTKDRNISSELVRALSSKTIVTVEEIDGEYCRISEPCRGWIPFISIKGKTKLIEVTQIKHQKY